MVAEWKIKEVKELEEKIKGSKVVALARIENIPARQFQSIRRKLKKDVIIRVSRRRLLQRALRNSKIDELSEKAEGSVALILTNLDPFKLNSLLKESKAPSPAKPGQRAPFDIVVPKGETSLPPGPVIGELQQVGIKAQIKGGKIVIVEDCVLVKKGDTISEKIANVLNRLGIEPFETGLELIAAYEDGVLYPREILDITKDDVLNQLKDAHSKALNLAVNAKIFTKESVPFLLQDAHSKALNLAFNARIFVKETVEMFIAQAYREMISLASKLSDDALDDDLKARIAGLEVEKPKEEKEEKKEEKEEKAAKEEKPEEDAAAGLASLFG